jgi:hypothetical protein
MPLEVGYYVKLTLLLTPESKKPLWLFALTLPRSELNPESQNQNGLDLSMWQHRQADITAKTFLLQQLF